MCLGSLARRAASSASSARKARSGDLSITGDVSYILSYDVGEYKIAGIPYSIGYDGVGYVNNGSARPGGQRITPWRGTVTFNWRKDKHNFNWSTRYVSSITNNDQGLIDASAFPSASRNANIGGANGIVSQSCPQVGFVAPPIPDAAGTGLYGVRGVVGATASSSPA
jgi:hypothetical protein